jgi:two-component system chemotaxis response regulator CheY
MITVEHKKPVLIVDDEEMMIVVMSRILQRLGYTAVDQAPNGIVALEKMRATRFGVVICDWLMTPMSGYELLRVVRSDPDLHATPFIMATTQTVMQNAIAAKTAGVSGYLLKPFAPDSLRTAIEGVRRVTPL